MIPLTTEKALFNGYKTGGKNPLFVISGPCVIEGEEVLRKTASELKTICSSNDIPFIFKSSYDKANRSSFESFRGPGLKEGLQMLAEIKKEFSVPILTDIHSVHEVEKAAEVADFLQIPAFLCRQTDLVAEAARTQKWLNIKKGQFVAPKDALQIIEKVHSSGSDKVFICERGYSFGYNNLVVDMRGIEFLRKEGVQVVMDMTHSTQLPGGGKESGGQREMAYPLGRAAVAVGIEGLFMEVHPNPPSAMSDSTNQLFLKDARRILENLIQLDSLAKQRSL